MMKQLAFYKFQKRTVNANNFAGFIFRIGWLKNMFAG